MHLNKKTADKLLQTDHYSDKICKCVTKCWKRKK